MFHVIEKTLHIVWVLYKEKMVKVYFIGCAIISQSLAFEHDVCFEKKKKRRR